MKKLSLWKKLSMYFLYRKIILSSELEFSSTLSLRVDRVNRLYTILNIPPEVYQEPYSLRKSDIDKLSEPYIKEFTRQISSFLDKKGLSELYKLYSIKKVDKYSYLIVIGFSYFDTLKMAKKILIRIPILIFILLFILYIFKAA